MFFLANHFALDKFVSHGCRRGASTPLRPCEATALRRRERAEAPGDAECASISLGGAPGGASLLSYFPSLSILLLRPLLFPLHSASLRLCTIPLFPFASCPPSSPSLLSPSFSHPSNSEARKKRRSTFVKKQPLPLSRARPCAGGRRGDEASRFGVTKPTSPKAALGRRSVMPAQKT